MALAGSRVRCSGHVRLSTLPDEPVITIVRDPVDRFVSAFDWLRVRQLCRWGSAESLALSLHDERARQFMSDTLVLWPLRRWLDTDRPLLWVGRTETLDADVERLAALLGSSLELPPRGSRNEGTRSVLSPAAEAVIREWYADDYPLLEAL